MRWDGGTFAFPCPICGIYIYMVVYGTSIIGAAVTRKDKNKESKNLFIKSLGKTQSKKRKHIIITFN